jgi:hypothetical protein
MSRRDVWEAGIRSARHDKVGLEQHLVLAQQYPDIDERISELRRVLNDIDNARGVAPRTLFYIALRWAAYRIEVELEAEANEKSGATPGS